MNYLRLRIYRGLTGLDADHLSGPGIYCFLDEEASKMSVVQVHPDSASMEFHLQVNAKHFTTAFDYLDSLMSDQYFGVMSETLAAEIAKWDDAVSTVMHMPVHESGFTRTSVR